MSVCGITLQGKQYLTTYFYLLRQKYVVIFTKYI